MDTGTEFIVIDLSTYVALQNYFAAGGAEAEPAFLSIYVNEVYGPRTVVNSLLLKLTRAFWDFATRSGIIKPWIEGENQPIIGAPIFLWYSYVQFDITAGSFTFIPRRDLDEFMEAFKNAAE